MPRKKKKSPAAEMAAAVAEMPLAEQLEAVALPEPTESVAARLKKVGELVAACDAAGVDVPLAVRQSVPTQEEVIADYKRQAQLATAADNAAKYLRDHLLGVVDASYTADPTGDYERFYGEGYELVRTPGFHETISKTLLVQLGVDPDLIDRATVVTPYYYWAIKEPKAAKDPA